MIFEIAKISLDNEMDLILSHRRSMKLAELAGLSLAAQTTLATAIAELARGVIDSQQRGVLSLGIESKDRNNYIVGSLTSPFRKGQSQNPGINYARKLVSNIDVSVIEDENIVRLRYFFASGFKMDHQKIDEWKLFYKNEPSLSHYDELKKKNEQLQELSARLQKSENDYKSLTNSLPLIIFSINQDGNLVYSNDWLVEMTGQSVTQINKSAWKNILFSEDQAAFDFLISCIQKNSEVNLKAECRLKTKAGDYLWHQVSLSPLKGEVPGQIIWTGFMADIHTQKTLEATLQDNEELKKAQESLSQNKMILEKYIDELNQTNAELQQFAYITSHDLQEPVRKLLFYADTLLRRADKISDEEKFRMLTKIHSSSVRMRSLIHDTLMFARIGKEAIRFERVSLNKLVKDVVQELETTIALKNADITIGELPDVIGNYGLLGQVFSNLVTNSLKFVRDEINPVIHINGTVEDGFASLTVADNGIGFNEEYQPKMFALFQRLHNQQEFEGTGLGLAICKKIVHLHHGSISAKSKEGDGAVFHVRIPVSKMHNYV